MTDLPDLKIKALVSFPAAVFGGTGLAVRKENGQYYFDLAFGELAQIGSIPAPVLPTTFLALWEQTQDSYQRISVSDLAAQIDTGISDAPIDGTLYGRKNAAWQAVPASISDAPSDGSTYGRLNGAWTTVLPLTGGTLTGALILAADPIVPLGAATKAYVDANLGGTGAVRYDIAQSLTAAQRAQARQNVYAAPFDALAYNGMQINGSMDVDQFACGAALTVVNSATTRLADGWVAARNHTAATAVFLGQVLPPPSPAFGGAFQNCLRLHASTAMASVAASDYAMLVQYIEGYRFARVAFGTVAGQSVTIGFWVYATIAGTGTVSLRNGTNNRSYLVNVTINNAATWEYKTVIIPPEPSGSWSSTTSFGAAVGFCFACGSSLQGAAGAWASTGNIGTSATTNFFATNGNVVAITGVVVLPGTEAPLAAYSPNILRPFSEEHRLAQRYYVKSFDVATAPAQNIGSVGSLVAVAATAGAGSISFRQYWPVPLRAAPTVVTYNTNAANSDWWDVNGGASRACALADQCATSVRIVMNAPSTAGSQHFISWAADARF